MNQSSHSTRSKFFTLTAYLFGIGTGAFFQSHYTGLQTKYVGPTHGTVTQLSTTPIRNTVHIDTEGRPITKQQLIEPFLIPNLVGVSVATFLPGQTMMPPHEHETMHEIFYVLEGEGVFQIDGVEHDVGPGTLLHFAPGEAHGIWVKKEGKKEGPLKMFVTGVAIGEKNGWLWIWLNDTLGYDDDDDDDALYRSGVEIS